MSTLTGPRSMFFAVFLCFLLPLSQVTGSLPTVAFTAMSSSKSESSGVFTVYIERTVNTSIETTLTIDLSGSATKGSDYILITSLSDITFAPGDIFKNISLYIVDDQEVESGSPETINFTIPVDDAAYNRKENYTSHVVKIKDNDVSIECVDSNVSESAGSASIRITRTGSKEAKNETHSFGCYTRNDTADSPSDYTKTHAEFSFSSPNQDGYMVIPIENDYVPESNETFNIRCGTNDPRVKIDSSCRDATVTIENDDTYVFLCPGGHAASVNENAGSYSVDICRVGVVSTAPTVKLCRTSEQVVLPSISPGCDNVSFTANSDRVTATIAITDDNDGETENQDFEVFLNNSDPAIKINETGRVTVTLVDDDNTFYLPDKTELVKTEGDGSPSVNVTIKRNGKISVAANVSLALDFNFTASSADCTGTSPRVIQFDSKEDGKTITVCTVVDDRLIEDDKTFKVIISGQDGSNVRSGGAAKTIKLISDDVNIACQGAFLKEASGPAVIRLNRTGATAVTANNILCSTANGTAVSPNDYIPKSSEKVSFALDQLNNTFDVVLQNDRVVESNESFTVTCNTSDPRVVVDPSCGGIQIDIINDDTYVYFCPGYSTSIEENVGSYTVRLCRVGVLEDIHTVKLCRSSDSVSLAHDYPAVQAQCDDIVFVAYDEVKDLVIPVTNDTWGEQEYKTFNISMNTTDAGVTFNDTTSYVVTIHDDDNTFCFTRTSPKVYEEHDKFINLTIRRTGAITVSNASVIVNTSPQSAVTPEDYTEPILNQRITFFVGEIEKNVSVSIINDKIVEDDQTFQLSLTGVDGSTVFPDCKTSTVIVGSNNVLIFCRDQRGLQSVHENKGPVLMEFTREGSLQYNHTMRIRTINGTAISGQDYTAIDKILTFAPHQTSMKESIVIWNDNVLEPDETFRLSVTSSDDRVHMICPGTEIKIVNDDTFIRCANQSIEVNEGDKTATFTLKREGVLSTASPIWFSTKDGTAFDKSDYKPQNQASRTFLPGQVYMTLSIDLVDDDYNEDDETFSVVIGSHVPTTLTSGDSCVLITIKDNDPDRMTEQQAQELLVKQRNSLIVLGVAFAFMVLVILIFLLCICYLYGRFKRYTEKEEKA